MRYSRTFLAPAGFSQVLPEVTLEFFGRVSWTIVEFASGEARGR
jgi:hypothetical protein